MEGAKWRALSVFVSVSHLVNLSCVSVCVACVFVCRVHTFILLSRFFEESFQESRVTLFVSQ